MEDQDDDTRHAASVSIGGPALSRRVRAYVGLGANLDDAAATLAKAISALAALPNVRLAGVSRLYATEPVGLTDQPEFRNAVVALDVPAGPDPETGATALLLALKGIERAFGRRARERWGPRELDLDLLVFGRHRVAAERPVEARSDDPSKPADLVVPHRLAGERLFVLAPLADLAPRLVPPGWQEAVETARLRRERIEGAAAVRPIARWDGDAWRPTATGTVGGAPE
jgi:2-amino-4-hydroxy-6-hydroxymethyldihydropteridine diphosphokinase